MVLKINANLPSFLSNLKDRFANNTSKDGKIKDISKDVCCSEHNKIKGVLIAAAIATAIGLTILAAALVAVPVLFLTGTFTVATSAACCLVASVGAVIGLVGITTINAISVTTPI